MCMKAVINYGEFYPKPLITIGENDRILALEKTIEVVNENIHCTHWLVALEGSVISPGTDFYQWQVVVYPAKACGGFNFKFPYFQSPYYLSFNDAVQFMRELEQKALQDELYSVAG